VRWRGASTWPSASASCWSWPCSSPCWARWARACTWSWCSWCSGRTRSCWSRSGADRRRARRRWGCAWWRSTARRSAGWRRSPATCCGPSTCCRSAMPRGWSPAWPMRIRAASATWSRARWSCMPDASAITRRRRSIRYSCRRRSCCRRNRARSSPSPSARRSW